MKKIRIGLLGGFLLLASLSAQAHRQWLLPSATQLEGSEPVVTIDAAVSENLFDYDSFPLKLDGLTISGPAGAMPLPEPVFRGKKRNSFDLRLPSPGTYRIALVGEEAMATYRLNGEVRRWRGNAAAVASEIPAGAEGLAVTTTLSRIETYVSAGQPDATVLRPLGHGLELLPLVHPNELQLGQPARFRFLLDGVPAAGLTVAIVPGGVRYRGALREISVKTDARGEFSVNWPFPQMYWINASFPPRGELAEGQARPEPPARRYNYGGTFEVLP